MRVVHRMFAGMAVMGVVAFLFSVGLRPAGAADARRERDAVRQKEAAVKVQIDMATASDDQVEAEAGRLAKAVISEQLAQASVLSAVAAADVQVARSQRRLDEIALRFNAARRSVVGRAVMLYEHPFQMQRLLLHGATDINQYAERQALVAIVQGGSANVVDIYRQQRLDEQAARRDLDRARAEGVARRALLAAEGERLAAARQHADEAHKALQARIADLQFETKGLAQQEGKLQGQLAAEEAALARQNGGYVFNGPQPGLVWPVQGPVTREFGNQHGGYHPGIDIAPIFGTPIHAPADGVVIYASWESGYGNYTCINHGAGVSSCFGHQSRIDVSVGQIVRQGQVIGLEGSTGDSTGPHVHFEVRVNNVPANPRDFIGGSP